jgi:thymidylate kinase
MKGLITIEGCEGVGKSTQLQLLKNYCDKNNIKAVFTREPGGSIIAEKIRNIILDGKNTKMSDKCEALLYAASRNQHIHDIIIPALKNQNIVFCDRYIDSTFAYQGYGRELGTIIFQCSIIYLLENIFPNIRFFLILNQEKHF